MRKRKKRMIEKISMGIGKEKRKGNKTKWKEKKKGKSDKKERKEKKKTIW